MVPDDGIGNMRGKPLPGDIIYSIVENFRSSGLNEDVLSFLPQSFSILHLDNEENMIKWLKIVCKILFPTKKSNSEENYRIEESNILLDFRSNMN